MGFETIDYVVFCTMLLGSLIIGVYFGYSGKGQRSTEEYLLGNKQMKTIPIAISLVASQLTGILIVSVPGEIYVHGTQYMMIIVVMIFVVWIINNIFLPVFYENDITNCYEYLELRFNATIRDIITFLYIITVFLVIPLMLFVPAIVFAKVTGINIHLTNTVVTGVCVFYTMMGGVKAVVWTDVIQGLIMILSAVGVAYYGVMNVGSVSEVLSTAYSAGKIELFNIDFDLTTRHTFWNVMFGYTILWTCYIGLNQTSIQRIVSVPTIDHAKRALTYFGAGFFIVVALNCFIGLIMYALYVDCDPLKTQEVKKPDELVPYFVQNILSHHQGMTGLFVSCVFSAGMSTMSANLNAISGMLYETHIQPRINHNETKAFYIMASIVALIGVYSVLMGFVVQRFESVLQMVIIMLTVNNGTTMGVFTLGMMWPKTNSKGAFWGIICSVVAVSTLLFGHQIREAELQEPYYNPYTTTNNCTGEFNLTTTNITMDEHSSEEDESFSIFDIAFPWFTVISFLIVWIVGVLVSLCTKGNELQNPKLYPPVIYKLIPTRESFQPESGETLKMKS